MNFLFCLVLVVIIMCIRQAAEKACRVFHFNSSSIKMDDIPAKKAKKNNKTACLIHVTNDDTEPLRPRDYASWQILHQAAITLQHKPLLEAAAQVQGEEVPSCVYYHRRCRSQFTLEAKRKASSNHDETVVQPTETIRMAYKRSVPRQSIVYEKKCIICAKPNKYIKGTHTKEDLTQCCELRANKTLRERAKEKNDSLAC